MCLFQMLLSYLIDGNYTIWHLLLIVYISQVTTYLLLLMLSCTLLHPYIQNLVGIYYMSHHLLNYAPFRIFNKFPRKSNFQAYLTYLEQIRIIIILLILFPSSEIRVLCLLKSSSEMLQYLPRTRRFTYHLGVFFRS